MKGRKQIAGTTLDPTIQFAKLKLGSKEYQLCYDFGAIAEAERVSGCNLLIGLESLSNINAAQLRGLFYAALVVAQPDMTIERAAGLIKVNTLGKITTALAQAYTLSMADPSEHPPEADAESAPAKA